MTSQRTTSASGSASAGSPVRITPPSSMSRATSSSASCCDPPRGDGQPSTWPATARMQPEAAARTPLERQDRVRAETGEERARPLLLEARRERAGVREERRTPRAAERAQRRERRHRRRRERPEERRLERRPSARRAGARARGTLAVAPELRRGLLDAPAQRRPRSRRRADAPPPPADRPSRPRARASAAPARCAPNGCTDEQRSWTKPGKRQLRGAQPAAGDLLRLEDRDLEPRLREHDRADKAVRPRADDDRPRAHYASPRRKARRSRAISRAITSAGSRSCPRRSA